MRFQLISLVCRLENDPSHGSSRTFTAYIRCFIGRFLNIISTPDLTFETSSKKPQPKDTSKPKLEGIERLTW